MPHRLGLAKIEGAERLEAALTPSFWEDGGPQAIVRKRRQATVDLFDAVGRLLACWTQHRVEEEAWLYSITWAEPPSLVRDFDLAFEILSQLEQPLLDEFRGGNTYPTAPAPAQTIPFEMVRPRLAELARRVEYLMSRAADLRLSRQLDDLRSTFADRLAQELLNDLERVATIGDELSRAEALNALGDRLPVLRRLLATPSPATAELVAQVEKRVRASQVAKAFVEHVVIPGTVNVMASGVFEWLKTLW